MIYWFAQRYFYLRRRVFWIFSVFLNCTKLKDLLISWYFAASRRRRISTGAKLTSAKGRKRSLANNQLTAEATRTSRFRSTSGSSFENLDEHKPLSVSRSEPLDHRKKSNAVAVLSSAGSDEEFLDSKSRRVPRNVAMTSPLTVRDRSSTVGGSNEAVSRKLVSWLTANS